MISRGCNECKRALGKGVGFMKASIELLGVYYAKVKSERRGRNGQIALGMKKHANSDSHRITEIRMA